MSLFVNLKNCHGIVKLESTLQFKNNTILIYASNGIMKTSFSKTIKDISQGDFGNIPNFFNKGKNFHCNIKINGNKIEHKQYKDLFYVVDSFDNDFNFDNISPLIKNDELKEKYFEKSNEIKKTEEQLIDKLRKKSKLKIKKGYRKEQVFLNEFQKIFDSSGSFLDILLSFENKLDKEFINFEDVSYEMLFSKDSLSILKDEIFIKHVELYYENLKKLLDESILFNEENFNNYNVNKLLKSIETNNLFKAGHKIILTDGTTINSIDEFKSLVKDEKDKIFSEENTKEYFTKIEKMLDKNNNTRNLNQLFLENITLLRFIKEKNINAIKQNYWLFLLKDNYELYTECMDIYKKNKNELKEIINDINRNISQAELIVEKFNNRFNVPYTLKIKNQKNVILYEDIPQIYFINENGKEISLDDLKIINSEGQKRALYLLSIFYQIEIRNMNNQETIIIFDDIVDSFDYENKYAIIEYLNEISQNNLFKMIILTHNFDFFRIILSRLDLPSAYFANKEKTNFAETIKLSKQNLEGKDKDIFLKLKKDFNNNNTNKIFLTFIPFLRNLCQYQGDTANNNKLNKILHYSNEKIKIIDLKEIYNQWGLTIDLNSFEDNIKNGTPIYDLIYDEASKILKEKSGKLKLENKIILSMAIRLKMEEYIIEKVNINKEFSNNQTFQLYTEYKNKYPHEKDKIKIFEKVNMMTPENIHLNSFMYEPLIDMADYSLKKLYNEINEMINHD